jgi:hypothetical protein
VSSRGWKPISFFICIISATHMLAQERTLTIPEAVNNALKQSQITLPGAPPFHLKAAITNTAHPNSEYKAEIEEYWLSPQSWRRTIESPTFSQTLIMDGDKISETDHEDYYPLWLSDLVTAIFDPLPMHQQLQSFKGAVTLSGESEDDYSCFNFSVPTGIPPVHGVLPYAFCFTGKSGLLLEVATPGYKAHFADYKPFKNKMVARRISAQLAPDAVLEVTITTLDDAEPADRSLFAVDQATPVAAQLKSQQVAETTARSIATATLAPIWPPVREGKRSGALSVFVSVDKLGQVREVWPLASDNPELNETARDQVMHWRFQPYTNGVTMQMESVLTFAFDAMQGAPIPLLSNAEARKLGAHVVEPRLKKGTSPFMLRIRVDEHGKLVRVLNPKNAPPELYKAGEKALQQWKFRPYVHDGKADLFDADIDFKAR